MLSEIYLKTPNNLEEKENRIKKNPEKMRLSNYCKNFNANSNLIDDDWEKYLWKTNTKYELLYKKDDKESPLLIVKEVSIIDINKSISVQSINNSSEDLTSLIDNDISISQLQEDECRITYTYYPNGREEYIGTHRNQKWEGRGTWYYTNGKIRYSGIFKNGGPHNENCKIYYSNEKIQYSGQMIEGKRENYGKCYYDNGLLCIDGYFKNDKLEGEKITIYWSNGKLQYYGNMVSGKCEGHGKAYYISGRLRYEGNWKNDWPHGDNVTIYKEDG